MAEFFQHFKGGVYRKLHEGKDSETQQEVVVYQSCTNGEVWVRPKAMFDSLVYNPVKKYGSPVSIPRFKPITVAEKRELVNWRHDPCPGTGTKPPEDAVIRQEASWPGAHGGQIYTRGRTLCPTCDKNVSFTNRDGISAHKTTK